jgi:hypothetical protein
MTYTVIDANDRHAELEPAQIAKLLAKGYLTPDDRAWRDGLSEWTTINDLSEEMGIVMAPPPPTPLPVRPVRPKELPAKRRPSPVKRPAGVGLPIGIGCIMLGCVCIAVGWILAELRVVCLPLGFTFILTGAYALAARGT